MLYPAYKSNRTPTPDTVVQGMQYLKASIKAMSIKVIEVKIYQYAFAYNLDSYLLPPSHEKCNPAFEKNPTKSAILEIGSQLPA
jgi:hypothetical protein